MSKIILISGPTASGKSEFAVKIAKKVNGEIINADSMQIYKEIKILNTRPDKNLTKKVKHHLYGFVSVKTKFSVGKWVILANKLIKQIINKKKVPIIFSFHGHSRWDHGIGSEKIQSNCSIFLASLTRLLSTDMIEQCAGTKHSSTFSFQRQEIKVG